MVTGRGRVVVIGAGIGGLVAAALLAARGRQVMVLERAATSGGKVRTVRVGDAEIEAGPALLTMRDVFDAVFDAAGTTLDAHVTLRRQGVLARHVFADGSRLHLPAEGAADAVGRFAGGEVARGYRAYADRARRVFEALEGPMLRSAQPSRLGLAAAAPALGRLPFVTLWDALGEYFPDPRLRGVFARAAVYVGSSPLQAPATLMLVSHIERLGAWSVEGGMGRLIAALEWLARAKGAEVRHGAEVREVIVESGRAVGVRLADGEAVAAGAVIVNADAASLPAGRLGAVAARAVEAVPAARRSFSAVTWAVRGRVSGEVAAQTVFHPSDPTAEYAEIAYRGRLPRNPAVTLWAQGGDRLLVSVNAPARADVAPIPAEAVDALDTTVFGGMRGAGLEIERDGQDVTTPDAFERMFPGTGGALYGPAAQGWQAAFNRPGARTRLPGLYLAGGGTHPGAGMAMAALSGRFAAARVIEDRA